jgi:hypothetical protein
MSSADGKFPERPSAFLLAGVTVPDFFRGWQRLGFIEIKGE